MKRMTTIVFQEVKVRGVKTGKCACGGRTKVRREIFCHTINPYNQTATGRIKTYDEVLADVKAERDEWLKKPITCKNCERQTPR